MNALSGQCLIECPYQTFTENEYSHDIFRTTVSFTNRIEGLVYWNACIEGVVCWTAWQRRGFPWSDLFGMRVRVLSASYRSSTVTEVLRDELCVTFRDPMYQWMSGAGYPLTALQLTLVSIPSYRSLGVVM